MHQLTLQAKALLATPDPRAPERGVGPVWEYVPSASQFIARGGRARPIFEPTIVDGQVVEEF